MSTVRTSFNLPKHPAEQVNAVIYARYSSHGQTEQSIEGQLSKGHEYAAAKGYTVIHEYVDRAMTGRNDNRDQFQKMLSDTAKHQFSVIICWRWIGLDAIGKKSPLTSTPARKTESALSMSLKACRTRQRPLFWKAYWKEWQNTIPYSYPKTCFVGSLKAPKNASA